jgi:hypothetical protein
MLEIDEFAVQPHEEMRCQNILDGLCRHSINYLIGFVDASEGNQFTLTVDFKERTPISVFIGDKVCELDFRVKRLMKRQEEPIRKCRVDGRPRSRVDIRAALQGRLDRQEIIDNLQAELNVFSGTVMKPILFERDGEGITGYRIGELEVGK